MTCQSAKVVAWSLLVVACRPEPALTELMVVVDTDLAVPGALDGFNVRVLTELGVTEASVHYDLIGDQVSLPATFGVVPRDGDADRRVTVEVDATLAGSVRLTTSAVTGFVEGRDLWLDMFLACDCVGTTCPENETCRRDGCVPEAADPDELPEHRPDGGPGGGAGNRDRDGDGYGDPMCAGGTDCDDGDPSVHPDAPDNSAGEWTLETIDTEGHVGEYAAIALGADGVVHVSYEDETNGDLKYANNSGGIWGTQTIDATDDRGAFTDIALDSTGAVHVTCFDELPGDLIHVTNRSGPWVSEIVDFDGRTGRSTSIAVADDGRLLVSYYDETNGNLRYAWMDGGGGAWNRDTVDDSLFNTGSNSSIAAAPDGTVHVSYFDSTNSSLKIATSDGFDWALISPEVIDEEGVVGEYASIAVDPDAGFVRVAYYARTGGDLRYATNASGSWVTETVDSAGDTGSYASIAVAGGVVHIAYADNSARDLRYAHRTGGVWATETVDPKGNAGAYASIAVGPDDDVHIAYYEETDFDLLYATATRPEGDGIDQNCDGADGVDRDGDGFPSFSTGGQDCNDDDAEIHPDADDPPGDDDRDCDGAP